MLTETRWQKILELIEKNRSMTVDELRKELGASASTIRRDLAQLDRFGRLKKVHGGAAALDREFFSRELTMDEKDLLNSEKKETIGRFAAGLIAPGDFVYIDAGTTTDRMVDFIEEREASFVTNSVMHARKLARKGCRVFMPGGELKASTEALIGPMAIDSLSKYHFTRIFLGTNSVSVGAGFTTPDPNEALIKQYAIGQARQCYCLCDSSKFGAVSPISFAAFSQLTIITDILPDSTYAKYSNIIEAGKIDLS